MTMPELFVYAVASLGIAFLLCGLASLVFGSKRSSKSQKFEFSVFPPKYSGPYSASIFLCLVGLVLLYLAYNVVTQGGVPDQQSYGLWISSGHAQTSTREPDARTGWVYFGHESSPKSWNFKILGGGYRDLYEQRAGVVIKALRAVKIREDHFGSFTGTVFGFLSPEPRVAGTMVTGTCAVPEEIVSVGFSKIWVKVKPVACPR